MSKVIRGVKNVTKGYSSVQVKVRNGKQQGMQVSQRATDEDVSHIQRSMGSFRYRHG